MRFSLKNLLAFYSLACFLCGGVLAEEKPKFISLVQLLANPEKFDGLTVAVIGYLDMMPRNRQEMGFHGSDVLYFHLDDSLLSIWKNGIAIEATHEMELKPEDFDKQYVMIKGTFDSKAQGYKGSYSGTLSQIEVLPWREFAEKKPAK